MHLSSRFINSLTCHQGFPWYATAICNNDRAACNTEQGTNNRFCSSPQSSSRFSYHISIESFMLQQPHYLVMKLWLEGMPHLLVPAIRWAPADTLQTPLQCLMLACLASTLHHAMHLLEQVFPSVELMLRGAAVISYGSACNGHTWLYKFCPASMISHRHDTP